MRTLSENGRRQTWRELPVRSWVLILLALSFFSIYMAQQAIRDGLFARSLINHGHKVEATIVEFSGGRKTTRREADKITLRYDVPGDSKQYEKTLKRLDYTAQNANDVFEWNSKLTIFVDKADPNNISTTAVPASWLTALFKPLLLVPMVLVSGLMVWWKRRKLMDVYRSGAEVNATVTDMHPSAIVPGCKVVKVNPQGAGTKLVSLVAPNNAADLSKGHTVRVIVDVVESPGTALLCSAYE